MKIFHLTASYKPAYIYGGPIMSVSMLCEGLVEKKKLKAESLMLKGQMGRPELEVFTTTANGLNELVVQAGQPTMIDGVSVTYFKRWTKDHSHFSPGLLWALRKMLLHFVKLNMASAQHEDVVVHIHAWWNLVSVLSCWVAKWYKIPVILSPRGMLNDYTQSNRNSFSKKVIHQFIGKDLLKYVHIHATSEQEKLEILKIITPKSIAVIPNLISLSREYQIARIKYQVASSEDQRSSKILNLIFLSRIEKKKGLELIFDALSKLDFHFNLTIAGSGDENYIKSLKRKAESLKLSDRVKWIGQVGNEEKFKLMTEHDLLVLTSYNENFANVVIESLSVGTPVLISERVGIADYVALNELGWICSLEPNDIAEKITEAYGAIARREKINSTAPFIIEKDFSAEALVGRYLELYENVLQLRSE